MVIVFWSVFGAQCVASWLTSTGATGSSSDPLRSPPTGLILAPMAEQTTVMPETDDEIDVIDSKTLDAYINRGIKRYVGKVPQATVVGWYGKNGIEWIRLPTLKADGSAVVHPLPIDPHSVPMSIFQNDAVIRVYTLPMPVPSPRPAEWVDRPPRRFTFTKTAPTVVIEEMSLATVGQEIVSEWKELADELVTADEELELVMELVESMESAQPPGANLKEWVRKADLLEALEARDHREVDDEEEEEETEQNVPNGAASQETSP